MISTVLDNRRFRNWGGQILLLGGFAALLSWLVSNTVTNLDARGIRVGFDFLSRQANFPISESVLPYNPSDTFLWAYVTGVANTLAISVLAILLSTAIGLFVGLARRSKHPLTSGAAGVFVTTMRNMPLIVHLLFWYACDDRASGAASSVQSAARRLPVTTWVLCSLNSAGRRVDHPGWLSGGQRCACRYPRSPNDRSGSI